MPAALQFRARWSRLRLAALLFYVPCLFIPTGRGGAADGCKTIFRRLPLAILGARQRRRFVAACLSAEARRSPLLMSLEIGCH